MGQTSAIEVRNTSGNGSWRRSLLPASRRAENFQCKKWRFPARHGGTQKWLVYKGNPVKMWHCIAFQSGLGCYWSCINQDSRSLGNSNHPTFKAVCFFRSWIPHGTQGLDHQQDLQPSNDFKEKYSAWQKAFTERKHAEKI